MKREETGGGLFGRDGKVNWDGRGLENQISTESKTKVAKQKNINDHALKEGNAENRGGGGKQR